MRVSTDENGKSIDSFCAAVIWLLIYILLLSFLIMSFITVGLIAAEGNLNIFTILERKKTTKIG